MPRDAIVIVIITIMESLLASMKWGLIIPPSSSPFLSLPSQLMELLLPPRLKPPDQTQDTQLHLNFR